jgi:DNA-binding MarR family transcriptional regulator
VLVEVTPRGLVQHRESLAARRADLAARLANLSQEDLATLATALAPLERLAVQNEQAPAASAKSE